MTEDHRDLLLRIHQDVMAQAHAQGGWNWSRWHFLLLINTGLVASAATILAGESPHRFAIAIGEAVVGLLAAGAWLHAAHHGAFCYRMREYQAREIEHLLGEPFKSLGIFTRGGYVIERARNAETVRFQFERPSERSRLDPRLWRVNLMAVPARCLTNLVLPFVFVVGWLAVIVCSIVGLSAG